MTNYQINSCYPEILNLPSNLKWVFKVKIHIWFLKNSMFKRKENLELKKNHFKKDFH